MQSHFLISKAPLLKDSVFAFWQVHKRNDPAAHETILPKGAAEFIFSFETSAISARISNQTIDIPRCFVRGFNTIPIQLHLNVWQSFFGVVLYRYPIRIS